MRELRPSNRECSEMKTWQISILAAIVGLPAIAHAASGSIGLRAIAPVVCNVEVIGAPVLQSATEASLGTVRELCNAPRGYRIEVVYQPGTLVGATVRLGNDVVRLDGAGRAVITDAMSANMQTRALSISSDATGLDVGSLELRIDHKG
jgi:hypothetical protein